MFSSGNGSLVGEAELPGGEVFAAITGSVGGNKVTILTTYNSFSPGYVATFVGTLSADGSTMSGTWESNRNQSGTWTATRAGGASIAVAVSTPQKVVVGGQVDVTVKVTAGKEDLTNVDLGSGLQSSGAEAVVTEKPAGITGFNLAAGTSQTFTFKVKGAKPGKATLDASASAESKTSGTVHGSGSAKLQVGETLSIDWKMPARLDYDSSNWSGELGLPPASYVSPADWTVDLFLTDGTSKVCPSGVTWEWKVTREGKTVTLDSNRCSAEAKVPKLGTYTVKAIQLKDAVETGTVATNDHVVVRDWLIVGLGDSNGSGQGNPPYINTRCDRSVVSYQYQVALYIEKHDPRSSVTFVFDACSGARSDQVWQNPYEGQEPSGGVMLPPQIEQVMGVIGARKPDAVIMSVGINDLYFGSIMAFCATYLPSGSLTPGAPQGPADCHNEEVTPTKDALGYTTAYSSSIESGHVATVAVRTAERLSVLPGRLALLNQHLASLGAARIFASQYPDETTDQNGHICNNTGPFPKLSSAVWGWLQQTGNALNSVVAGTSSLGWIPITGVADGFIKHGYCSTDSYFDTPAESQWEQGNRAGSFHATAKGAAITFALTRNKVCEVLYGNAACDGEPPAPK